MGNWFKDKAIEIATIKANEKVNLYPEGVKTDKVLDASAIGEKNSERIQQGLATDSFLEFLAGLHHDNKVWWAVRLELEARQIREGYYGN